MELSDDGFALIQREEALIEGLYDDPSKYCTYGVGHLVHRRPSFLLAAAQADKAWKGYIRLRWKKLPYLDRSVRLATDFDRLVQAATQLAQAALGPGQGDRPVQAERSVLASEPGALLREKVGEFERAVRTAVKVPLTQGEFDALVSFAYNIGTGAFAKSGAVKRINEGRYKAGDVAVRRAGIAAIEQGILAWNRSGGKVLPGLQQRRTREADAFLAEARRQLAELEGRGSDKPLPWPPLSLDPAATLLIAPDSVLAPYCPTFPAFRHDWKAMIGF